MKIIGREIVTADADGAALAAVPSSATVGHVQGLILQPQGGDVRVRGDGAAPSQTQDLKIVDGEVLEWEAFAGEETGTNAQRFADLRIARDNAEASDVPVLVLYMGR